eukprot:14104904-Ditylum_brightwellii.AAC.1
MHLQCDDNIWIVTDKGKEDTDRYYSWVIAMDTTILWKGKGYIQTNPTLLEMQCTEGVGHLAAVAQIKQIYQEMRCNIPMFWVKGHWDDKCDKNKLKWEATLNVRADGLATEARFAITNKQRNEPINLLPVCSTQFFISGELIT